MEDELPSGDLPADAEAMIRAKHAIAARAKVVGLESIDSLRKHLCVRALSPSEQECRVMAATLHLAKGCSREDLGDSLARDASKARWGTMRSMLGSDGLAEQLAAVAGKVEGPRGDLARAALGSMAPAPALRGAAGEGEEGEGEGEAEEGGDGEGGDEGGPTNGLSPFGQALLSWCKAAL